ncbi:alpha/beta hydrolase-fold protein [Ramlibacter sp. PS3R-8]|uniref:alpha/beta hydrolase n=1 Tax=Ramlibacter sp. PS3R-8 TaxID=3133437 RepID=UPI0030B65011
MQARFASAVRSLFLWCMVLTLAACGGGGGSEGVPPGEPVGRVETFTIASARNGATYEISVYLPASYATGTRTYPVIYAVEGDARHGYFNASDTRFDAFARVMQRRGTQAILVGIGGVYRRNTDFLLPGAERYHAFIVQELVARIQSQYRVDPSRRALTGLSHGGYFVLAALALEATAGTIRFSHFLSTEASTGGGDAGVDTLEQRLAQAGRPVPTTLFLAGGSQGTTNGSLVLSLYGRLRAANYAGMTVEHMGFAASHVGTDVPAFEEALGRYFP